MKLLITGCESFVGKALLSRCDTAGIDYLGIDMFKSQNPKCLQIDINSPAVVEIIPEEVDAFIHLAALSRDPDCKNRAYECFQNNVMGTLNLMNAAQVRKAKQFVFSSSEWVYDFNGSEMKNEESPINIANHKSEYALSKLVSEANLRQKYQHGFCPTTILRFGIIYGPRPGNWSAVESLFNSTATQNEVSVGSLKTARCFIHVEDIVSGILASVGLPSFEIINLCGDSLISLGDVIQGSSEVLKRKVEIIEKDPTHPNLRPVSNSKAKKILSWKPEHSLLRGLETLRSSIEKK